MVKYIPFAEIKAAVSIEQVMEKCGLPFKKQGNSFRCECPVHKGGKRSLVVTPGEKDQKGDYGVFYCHAAEDGGDRIGLLAHVTGTGQYAAVKALAETYRPHLLDGSKAADTVPEERNEKTRSGRRGFQPLPYLQFDHGAVRATGLTPEVAETLGIGYAPRGVHRGRLAVPVRHTDGRIAGYLSFDGGVKLPPKWQL